MTSSNPATIVHESRTQRQSVRLKLPLKVEFDEQIFESDDWSHSGVGILIPENSPMPVQGRFMEATLHFPLEGCDLSLPIELEVSHCDEQNHRIGCRFQNISEQQQSTLHFLISAYMTGDLIQVGDIMHIAARDNHERERKIPALQDSLTPTQLRNRALRNFARAFALTTLFVALITYVAMSIYEKTSLITSEAAYLFSNDTLLVESPYGGTVTYHVTNRVHIAKGAPLATIMEGGTAKTIPSPCDCITKQPMLSDNQLVAAGTSLLELVPADSSALIRGSFTFHDAMRLQENQKVTFTLMGDPTSHAGSLHQIESQTLQTDKVSVTIRPDKPLLAHQLGIPAVIRIDTLQWLP